MTIHVRCASRVLTTVARPEGSIEPFKTLLGLVGEVGVWMATLRHAATCFSWSLFDTVCEVERSECVVLCSLRREQRMGWTRGDRGTIHIRQCRDDIKGTVVFSVQ